MEMTGFFDGSCLDVRHLRYGLAWLAAIPHEYMDFLENGGMRYLSSQGVRH